MSNKALLTAITVLLFGVLTVLAIETFDHDTPSEKVAEAVQELGDEISDATNG